MTASPKHPTNDFKYWRYMQPGSQELRDIKAHYAAIIRGLVPGSIPFSAYGRVVNPPVNTLRDLWPGPTVTQPYSASGVAMTLQSTSADDSAAGPGLQAVEIHYITAAGLAASFITDMAGLTPVVFPENARFVECLHITRGVKAVGTITVEDSIGTVYSIIPAGELRCASAMRFIPENKRFFLMDITGGSGSGTSAAVTELSLISTELDGHGYIDEGIYIPHNGIVLQDGSLAYAMAGLFSVGPGQIVGGQCQTDKSAIITMSYSGWLEDL